MSRLSLAALCLISTLVASCGSSALGPSDQTNLVEVEVKGSAPIRGSNTFDVIMRRDGKPLLGASLDVVPTMPAMGHNAPVRPNVRELGGGLYHVEAVVFNMPGEWEVRYRVAFHDGVDARAYRYVVP